MTAGGCGSEVKAGQLPLQKLPALVHRSDIEPQTTSKKAGEQKQFGRRGPEEGATAGER